MIHIRKKTYTRNVEWMFNRKNRLFAIHCIAHGWKYNYLFFDDKQWEESKNSEIVKSILTFTREYKIEYPESYYENC